MKKRIAATLSIFLCLIVFSTAYAGSENLTAEQWREDLAYFARELPEKHKDLFHTMTPEEFQSAVHKLDRQIPSLQWHEITVEMARIVAKVGDGHTRIKLGMPPASFRFIPVKLYLFTDGLYVVQAPDSYAGLVGGRVTQIGDVKTDEAIRRISEVIPRDNEWTVKSILPLAIIQLEILHALKITNSLESVTLTIQKDSKETKHSVKPADNPMDVIQPTGWLDARDQKKPVPLYLKNRNEPYWYEYLKGPEILYVQYNSVSNKPDLSIAQFFNQVMAFAKDNPIGKFVLDIRFNGGGNNYLNKPIIIELIQATGINQRGKLFTIIGRDTFSAAMNCVNQLEKWTNTTFVGEPTGASPNHFGDNTPIKLPHSGLSVEASTLWWQDMDPRDQRKWRAPDIAAEMSFEDYREGRDPAMEAILSFNKAEAPLFVTLQEHLLADKMEEARKFYAEFKKDPKHKFVETENDINRLGYVLLQRNLYDKAIEVFLWNVQDYPKSYNAYDSLAEAYAAKGDRDLAIQYYKKALEINPKSRTAAAALQELQK